MNPPAQHASADHPLFEPDPDATYTLEVIAELTGVSSQTILHYQEHGLISPVADKAPDTRLFDEEALRTVRRIEHLRTFCEMNLSGLKLTLDLMDEIERLRADQRSRR